jgi:hypothetical protein
MTIEETKYIIQRNKESSKGSKEHLIYKKEDSTHEEGEANLETPTKIGGSSEE